MSHATGLENLSFNSISTYDVSKEIARGGMGIIFLASKNTGGVVDDVVLKCLRTITTDEEEKLTQEASIATMLRHENIVKTYGLELVPISKLPSEFQSLIKHEPSQEEKRSLLHKLTSRRGTQRITKVEEKHLLLLLMDYVKGTDFHTLLVRHIKKNLLFPVPLAAFVISRIASALSYAHTYIVHRDISPENILISDQGVCKLTDFGVAVVAHQQPEYWAGKLMYMAPEQIRNDTIDERADIFALGLVAYQAISGIQLLFAGGDLSFEEQLKTVYHQMEKKLVPLHRIRKDVPPELSRIISKMLAYAPEYRYQRAAAVVNDLEKEYLYAKGFGPTNNSLASYIDIFNSNFQEYNEDQLQQLSFLKNEHGRISLKRPLDVKGYTKAGQRLLAERKGSLVVNQLRRIHKEKKRRTTVTKSLEKIPIIKVKYLDNVIEGFSLDGEAPITAGRSAKNLILLPEKIVSGNHCKFYMHEDKAIVEDCQSHNGTIVNIKKITKCHLHEGDKVQVGSSTLYFMWEKRKRIPEYVISLSGPINSKALLASDLALQFFPNYEMLGKMNDIVDHLLELTPLGIMKRNVISPAVYEAMRIFSGEEGSERPMQLRINRAKKYISFRCVSPEESYGYESFLAAVYRRMDNAVDPKGRLEPEELAISLILKVFERIEIMRISREIIMTVFF